MDESRYTDRADTSVFQMEGGRRKEGGLVHSHTPIHAHQLDLHTHRGGMEVVVKGHSMWTK